VDLWAVAFDAMNAIESREDHLTLDQQMQMAQIKALLSIGQELSRIHHEGINPAYSSH
jgi:hypothetical protein